MSQILHIMRKDLRRLRWLVALWLAILAARTLLVVNGAAAADSSVATGLLVQQMWDTMMWLQFVLAALIVARLVLEEPLVGLTPFWLTRPYDAGSLLREKLLVAGIVLVGLPVVAELIMLSLFDAGPQALGRAGSTGVIAYTGWVLTLMALSTLVPSLSSFVMTVIGIGAVAVLVPTTLFGFATIWMDEVPGYTPSGPPDATPAIVMVGVYLAAAVAVVTYQYLHRRRGVAAGIAVAGLVAAVVLPMVWPFPFARNEQIRPGDWAAKVAVVHDPSWGTKVTEVTNVSRQMRGEWRRVNAHVTASGLPPRISLERMGIRSTLRLPNRPAVESSQNGRVGKLVQPSGNGGGVGSADSGHRDKFDEPENWTPLITLTEQELMPLRGRTGRLEATVDLITSQTHSVGTLRLTPGASLDRGDSRIEVAAVQRGTDSYTVTIRQLTTRSLLTFGSRILGQSLALRRRSSGEALMAGRENSWEAQGPPVASGFSVGTR